MTFSDKIGYVAAGLVLLAFCQKRMIPLRLAALGSNLAFFAYGFALGLAPVWFLHAILLPVNVGRLIEAMRLKRDNRYDTGTRPGVAETVSKLSRPSELADCSLRKDEF